MTTSQPNNWGPARKALAGLQALGQQHLAGQPDQGGPVRQALVGLQALWNQRTQDRLQALGQQHLAGQPDQGGPVRQALVGLQALGQQHLAEHPARQAKTRPVPTPRVRPRSTQPDVWAKINPWMPLGLLLAVLIGTIYFLYNVFVFSWPIESGFGEYTPPQGKSAGYLRPKTLWDWLQLLIVP